MKNYCRIMLGKKSVYAEECIAGNFIGADFGIRQDLSTHLPDGWLHFSREFIPIFLANNPSKSKVAAGLACSALWTISNDLNEGDIILSPDGIHETTLLSKGVSGARNSSRHLLVKAEKRSKR